MSASALRLKLDGAQVREFYAALQSAFTEAEMAGLLPRRLQRQLTEFGSPAAVYVDRLYILVNEAHLDGWANALLREVRNEKPNDSGLASFEMKLQPVPNLRPPNLQAAVVRNSEYVDGGMFDLLMRWVCRITCGEAGGTGLLIGPDLVVTNWHVLEDIRDLYHSLEHTVCVFDHKKIGQTEQPGRPVQIDLDWKIPSSPWSERDGYPDQAEPSQTELDYAILRLKSEVGNEAMGDPAKALPGTPTRGWFDMSVNFRHHRMPKDTTLTVIQHPKLPGQKQQLPLSLSLGLLRESALKRRVRYDSITDGGSSGSPCFNFKMEMIALHHATDRGFPPSFNQGIPIADIVDDWKGREKEFVDQGVKPPWKNSPNLAAPPANPQPIPTNPENALVLKRGGGAL